MVNWKVKSVADTTYQTVADTGKVNCYNNVKLILVAQVVEAKAPQDTLSTIQVMFIFQDSHGTMGLTKNTPNYKGVETPTLLDITEVC